MSYQKPTLTEEEKQVHAELLELAGGMGCPTQLSDVTLSQQQKDVMERLAKKGYMHLSKKMFMMLLPID